MTRRRVAAVAAMLSVALGLGPTAPAADRFVPGSVLGRGQSLRVGGFTGGLEYALTLGVALARAQGRQGNGQAQAVDLGVFGLILSQPGACTGTEPIPPDQVPRPLRVNSIEGERSATNAYADGQLVRGATEFAAASPDPSAQARTEVGVFELPSVASIIGLASTADARISERSQIRSSTGTTTVGAIDLAGGLVRLEDVHWSVSRTTGVKEARSETFTIGRIVVAGASLPSETPAELRDAFEAMSSALAPLGISMDAPTVRRRDDGTSEVTPIVLRFGGNDEANPVIGSLMAEVQPLRDALYEQLQGTGCPADPVYVNAALTVFDILLASFTGSGGLTLEIGGARALHDTTAYESPFGALPPFRPVVVPAPAVPRTATPGSPGAAPKLRAQAATAGRASTRCETTHPSGSPGCGRGSAALAGGISMLVALALLGTDYLRTHRRAAA
ncbi:MAG: hypothetical protein ACRDKJ_10550 [Actinomycetota bacterium]